MFRLELYFSFRSSYFNRSPPLYTNERQRFDAVAGIQTRKRRHGSHIVNFHIGRKRHLRNAPRSKANRFREHDTAHSAAAIRYHDIGVSEFGLSGKTAAHSHAGIQTSQMLGMQSIQTQDFHLPAGPAADEQKQKYDRYSPHFFTPTYMYATPNISFTLFTSSNPTPRIILSNFSREGNSSTEQGKYS